MKIIWQPSFPTDSVDIVGTRSQQLGFLTIKEQAFRFRKYDNTSSAVIKRQLVERQPAVAVLPYDPIQDKVLLIEQLRIATVAIEPSPWILEPIAGIVEPNESLLATAARESYEEAGIVVDKLIKMYSYFPSPGFSSEVITIYCAIIAMPKTQIYCGNKEEDEDIKTHIFATSDAFALLAQGKIVSSIGIIALSWLKDNHSKLRNNLTSFFDELKDGRD